ncbi:MAG: DUF2254 domain-containing protein [Bacteroidota bacterium]
MKMLTRPVVHVYKLLVSRIAFIPTLMGAAGLSVAIITLYMESHEYTNWLDDHLAFALVKGSENARMVLTTIIGGVLSLTVFSFSMVMVVLNRATASLSPRLLPQLIADKAHQVVLGFYMATIVFSLILIINIDNGNGVPSFGILLSMVATIICLGLFIYFIHSISQSIQVGNIMTSIYSDTLKRINKLKDKKPLPESALKVKWFPVLKAEKPGYYKFIDSDGLNDTEGAEVMLKICHCPEDFVLTKEPLLVSNQPDKFIRQKMRDSFEHSEQPPDDTSFISGFQKISEIAIKALSPGINDPGTAVRAIRLLNQLFSELLPYQDSHAQHTHDKKNLCIIYKLPSFDALMRGTILAIQHYADGSLQIIDALLDLYQSLIRQAESGIKGTLLNHLNALMQSSEGKTITKYDLDRIKKRVNQLINEDMITQ